MSVDENVFNILRAVAFKNSQNEATPAQHQRNLGLFDLIYVVKERFSYATSDFAAKLMHYLGLDSLGKPNFSKTRLLTFYEIIRYGKKT